MVDTTAASTAQQKSPVTVSGVANNAQKTQAATGKLAGDFNQFLTLLTTQLKNQDPLNPMDSTQFTNQLVQFSQVEQSINTNQKLDNLVSLQLGAAPSIALGYVGMDVNYLSSDMSYDGSTPVKVSYALDKAATSATINITNDQGAVVYSGPVNNNTGSNDFTWDGMTSYGTPAPAGTYSVSVDATAEDGSAINTSTVVSGRVRGVESQNGAIYLLVGDRAVPVGQVINATTAPKDTTNTDTAATDTSGGTTTDTTTTTTGTSTSGGTA